MLPAGEGAKGGRLSAARDGRTSPAGLHLLSNCAAVLQLVDVVVTTFGSDGADGLGDGPKAGLYWALNCVEGALLYEIEAKRSWVDGAA